MSDFQDVWRRLSDDSRDWMIDHYGEAVPDEVAAEIEGDPGSASAWLDYDEDGAVLSDEAVEWIDEYANGEHPEAD